MIALHAPISESSAYLLGGFYLSYLQKQGLFKRKFDFSVGPRDDGMRIYAGDVAVFKCLSLVTTRAIL